MAQRDNIMAFDPATAALALQGVSLLGNLGSSLLGRNDQRDALRKAEEENRRRIAQGNLSRAFGGNPAVDLVQPKLKQGLGTKILGGVGTAAGIGAQGLGLFNQARALQAQTAGRKLQNEAAQFDLDKAKGALSGTAANLADPISRSAPQIGGAGKIGAVANVGEQFAAPASQFTAGAPKLAGITGTPQAAPQLSNFSDPASVMASIGELSDTGKLSAQATVNQRQDNNSALRASAEAAQGKAQQEFAQQQFDNRLDIAGQNLDADKFKLSEKEANERIRALGVESIDAEKELLEARQTVSVTANVVRNNPAFINDVPTKLLPAVLVELSDDPDLLAQLGARLPAASMRGLQDIRGTSGFFESFKETYIQNKEVLGPLNLLGRIPSSDEGRIRDNIDNTSGALAALFRGMIESGVMTEADFERWEALVPSAETPYKKALRDFQSMESLLSTRTDAFVGTARDAGFFVPQKITLEDILKEKGRR